MSEGQARLLRSLPVLVGSFCRALAFTWIVAELLSVFKPLRASVHHEASLPEVGKGGV